MNRLLISGASGRMGSAAACLASAYGFEAQSFSPGMMGDILLDFSHPDCLPALLKAGLPLVIGTTGYSAEQMAAIHAAAADRPVFLAPNFSAGVYALEKLATQASALLPEWDQSLIERHHAQKRDSPSGTALHLAQALGMDPRRVLSLRAGTVTGIHEITLYGSDETLTLIHSAGSRAAFAHGALRAARWLLGQSAGFYTLDDLFERQDL